MFFSQLDQGSTIYGIRSDKYPNNKCFGIIITASCDIANNKTSKLHYIVGVDIDEWTLSDDCFFLSYIKSQSMIISNLLNPFGLDVNTLLEFDVDEAKCVINEYMQDSDTKTKTEAALDQYYTCKKSDLYERIQIIKNNPKPVIKVLKGINKGEYLHYYYLPEAGYSIKNETDKVLDRGIIVDLQEIGIISIEDARLIASEGIDYKSLSTYEKNAREKYKKLFWLNGKDDFIILKSNIACPWREHLMQRFSHSFIRIGVDGATDSDINKIKSRLEGK